MHNEHEDAELARKGERWSVNATHAGKRVPLEDIRREVEMLRLRGEHDRAFALAMLFFDDFMRRE